MHRSNGTWEIWEVAPSGMLCSAMVRMVGGDTAGGNLEGFHGRGCAGQSAGGEEHRGEQAGAIFFGTMGIHGTKRKPVWTAPARAIDCRCNACRGFFVEKNFAVQWSRSRKCYGSTR